MSKTCDFYMECAERGIFPLESDKPRPTGVRLRQFTTTDFYGKPMIVTGIGVSDCINWWNAKPNREVPVPTGMREFLEDFAGCQRCHDCGCVGRSHYFVETGDETLCVDCA